MNIVVLTGAGISAESGLKTFRDNGGLWEGHRMEDVATPEAFAAKPELVQNFYNLRRQQLRSDEVNCNAAHIALADFESQHKGRFTLITQNVDDLHQRAGSNNLLAMHGELRKVRCLHCDAVMSYDDAITSQSQCIQCLQLACLRPHIVWFGEMPLYMDMIERVLQSCELFVSIGTSSVVYPAAGFQQLAQHRGAHTVELNLAPSDTASRFDEAIYGNASTVVPEYFSGLLD